MSDSKKCGFIALLGAPNAGKSTLMNNLVGNKVSIITPKVQTTRTRISGITNIDNTQLIFIDTPGIFKPQKTLDKAMVRAAWNSAEDVDFTCVLVDAKKGLTQEVEMILNGLAKYPSPKILLINKIDIIKKDKLLELASRLHEKCDFEQSFMISAKKGDGVDDLKKFLVKNVKEGEWMYPEDQISDIPTRLFVAEITREKLMLKLGQELPYRTMVETESFEEKEPSKKNKNGEIKINQVIYVESENHKKIVVGKGGSTIKEIGEKSRKELEWLFEKKVHLFLFVKVQENWQNMRDKYEAMGLEFPN